MKSVKTQEAYDQQEKQSARTTTPRPNNREHKGTDFSVPVFPDRGACYGWSRQCRIG